MYPLSFWLDLITSLFAPSWVVTMPSGERHCFVSRSRMQGFLLSLAKPGSDITVTVKEPGKDACVITISFR